LKIIGNEMKEKEKGPNMTTNTLQLLTSNEGRILRLRLYHYYLLTLKWERFEEDCEVGKRAESRKPFSPQNLPRNLHQIN
jgi:hypothetical protein